jgi:ribokinase
MVDIVVVGSLNMDLVVSVDRMPQPGETVPGRDFRTIPGGKGANQAAAAALLGKDVAMVGRVGDDAFGPQLVDNLKRQGVNTAHVQLDKGAATGTAMITVDEMGQNSIVISAGANGRVAREDIDRLDGLLSQAKYLLLQFEIPLDTVQYAMERAHSHGVPVVVNPAPARVVSPAFLSQVDYLIPNESEASLLSGVQVRDLGSAEEAARRLRHSGVPVVMLTLGENGALLASEDKVCHVPAHRVQAVDTTAAGDALIGGLAAALVSGYSLEEATRYATCAGTLAVTRFGAQTSLPSAAEVEALYHRAPAAQRGSRGANACRR